jgi:glycosyltransferase involved in cell wall biosynthesis
MAIAEVTAPDSPHASPFRLHAVFWNALGPGSVAYTVNQLLDHMPRQGVDRNLWCLARDPALTRDYHRPALPALLYRILCKANVPAPAQGRLANHVVLRSVRPGDLVYVWPPYDLRLIRRAQEQGAIVVAERINCMAEMVRTTLSAAFARRGLPLPNGWCAPDAMAEELEQMLQCDFVTAANPLVAQSARNAGLPEERIIETSYGYDPRRLASAIGIERPQRAPVFAFVGLGNVRKGLDVLLEAWELADVRGKLLIAGHIDDDIRADYATILARPDVLELGFVKDIASVYGAADVFVFPSHEEGGPQVIYEAAACGLASIVSPMGAGRVVRDNQECLMVDPLRVDDLASAITKLANDEALRRSLGVNAANRAGEFTWAKVGMRLYKQFARVHAQAR